VRHYCRHCRTRLKVPVESEHHGFCARGCYASFYRSRCLVCEEPIRRKNEGQKFGSGHAVCRSKYRRFQHVYNPSGYHPTAAVRGGLKNPIKTGIKTAVRTNRQWPINLARLSRRSEAGGRFR
jgi:hypothetical protein